MNEYLEFLEEKMAVLLRSGSTGSVSGQYGPCDSHSLLRLEPRLDPGSPHKHISMVHQLQIMTPYIGHMIGMKGTVRKLMKERPYTTGCFELVLTRPIKALSIEVENVIPAINRALHKGAIHDASIERLRCTETGRFLGITSPTSTLQGLLQHRDLMLRAARMVFDAFSDVMPQQKWRWVKIHNISLVRYMGKTAGGLHLLREELEAENSGVSIPADIRWLSRAKVQARYQELKGGTSTVVAAVLGDATFSRVCKSDVRLFGRRYEVEAFEEARPDAFCNRCSRWGHVAPHCSAAPRCSICAEEHTMQDHRCPAEGCRAGRGRGCSHTTTRCANCKGPHGARADACAAKKEARQLAWRWRSPASAQA